MRSGRELVRSGRTLRDCPNTPLFEFTRETDYPVSASRQRGLAQRVVMTTNRMRKESLCSRLAIHTGVRHHERHRPRRDGRIGTIRATWSGGRLHDDTRHHAQETWHRNDSVLADLSGG